MRRAGISQSEYVAIFMSKGTEHCRSGHFWVLVAPGKHVLFEFSQHHDSAAVDRLLGGYEGYLVADAHVVYDHLYKSGKLVEVGCWAHCRRYFFAARESDCQRSPQSAVFWTGRRGLVRTREVVVGGGGLVSK